MIRPVRTAVIAASITGIEAAAGPATGAAVHAGAAQADEAEAFPGEVTEAVLGSVGRFWTKQGRSPALFYWVDTRWPLISEEISR